MTLDSREWREAVRQYAIDTGKDEAYALNRQVNNLAIFAMRFVHNAQAASIRAVESLDWWPKYIAKILHKKGPYTVKQARVYSKRLIRSRLVAIRFLRFFFVSLSRAIRVGALNKPSSGGKSFSGFDSVFRPATASNPHVEAAIGYTFRRRSDKTARKAEALLQAALNYAIPETIRDMKQYAERQAENRARRYSGGAR